MSPQSEKKARDIVADVFREYPDQKCPTEHWKYVIAAALDEARGIGLEDAARIAERSKQSVSKEVIQDGSVRIQVTAHNKACSLILRRIRDLWLNERRGNEQD